MTLANPFSTKTQNVTTIDADEINNAGAAIESALDGVGGSDGTPYTPATVLELGGLGLKLSETTGAASNLQLASRSVTRFQNIPWIAGSGDWTVLQGGMASNVTLGDYLYVGLDVPHGATLTSVTIYINPDGAHVGLPANMPRIRVSKIGIGGTETVIGVETTDATAFLVVYEAAHTITVSGLSEVIDRTAYRYNVRLQSESGANALAGMEYILTSTTCTVNSYTEY